MTSWRGTVVLVDAAPRGGLGSMTRYARMVEEAVRNAQPEAAVERMCLALPSSFLGRLPRRVANWIQHGWLWHESRRVLGRPRAHVLYHVLDGSHAYVARHLPGGCLAVTCHDLIPYLQLQGVLPGAPGRMAASVIRSSMAVVRNAACLTAVSESTKRDLIQHAGVDAGRIEVVNAVLDPLFQRRGGGIVPRAAARKPWILHVGNNASYKNRRGVVAVFERVLTRHDVTLILAGPPPTADVMSRLSMPHLAGRVRICVDPSDEEVWQLYRQCRLLLFPSTYEGFGSPVLEAMSSGCPVVCASSASLPEVTGGAALMAGATDTEGLATHCMRILDDAELADDLAGRGLMRAAEFSPRRMGEQFWGVYAGLAAGEAVRAVGR